MAEHDIPALLPSVPVDHSGLPVNHAEAALKDMLLAAGFADPRWHHRIELGSGFGWTEPDGFYLGDEDEPGICIYLDGLSRHIHGNPATAARDKVLRDKLRSLHYRVLEISASDLFDRGAMAAHFRKLARWLLGKDRAEKVAADDSWYRAPVEDGAGGAVGEGGPAAPDFGWPDAIDFLSAEWRVLAAALRDAGLPAPAEVDDDITYGGMTTGQQAILSWRRPDGRRVLLGRSATASDDPLVCAAPGDAPAAVATLLLKHLEG